MISEQRIGLWMIGSWGGVASSAAVGLAALQERCAEPTGLVTELPHFANCDLAPWSRFVVGGHEIRDCSFVEAAQKLHDSAGVFSPAMLEQVQPRLEKFNENVRPGTLTNVGSAIEQLASKKVKKLSKERPLATIERICNDLGQFREEYDLAHVIVVNVASTEPPLPPKEEDVCWEELSERLKKARNSPVFASSSYAIAAMLTECSYVNFTPSVGSNLPALEELALQHGVLHMGRDGKTGETLLKSILAPMFADRHLKVLSWVGHNIFGNLDGRVLDDPANKANKVSSKDHLLTEILGYKPQTLVSIEFIESMADWKTAWDHIHFQGFLDTKMTMQFTWQGCDSLLAAPLVLDLVRLTEREWRRGKSGVMTHLASFFKSPMGTDVAPFSQQYRLLMQWAQEVAELKT